MKRGASEYDDQHQPKRRRTISEQQAAIEDLLAISQEGENQGKSELWFMAFEGRFKEFWERFNPSSQKSLWGRLSGFLYFWQSSPALLPQELFKQALFSKPSHNPHKGVSAFQLLCDRNPEEALQIIELFADEIKLEDLLAIPDDDVTYPAPMPCLSFLLLNYEKPSKILMRFWGDPLISFLKQFKNPAGGNILHLAVMRRDIQLVQSVVEMGVAVNDFDDSGSAPLDYVNPEDDQIYELLIEKGAHLPRETCLHRAAYDGSLERIIMILDMIPALLHQRDAMGRTSLHLAVTGGNLEAVKMLLHKGADIHKKDKRGYPPIADADHFPEIKQLLEENGAQAFDKSQGNPFSETALHSAIASGRLDLVKKLIKQGADINAQNFHGQTAIHYAIMEGHFEILQTLLYNRIDLNISTYYSLETPLHYATSNHDDKFIRLLLGFGAKIDLKDNHCNTPLHRAFSFNNTSAINVLSMNQDDFKKENDSGQIPLFCLIDSPTVTVEDKIKTLEKLDKSRIEMRDSKGRTIVHAIVRSSISFEDKIKLIEWLSHLKISIDMPDKFDDTPLHCAAWENIDNTKIIQKLIELGANASNLNALDQTPLHLAAQEKATENIAFLSSVQIEPRVDLFNKTVSDYLRANRISQDKVDDALVAYCKEKGLEIHFSEIGNCSGWTFLYQYYFAIGHEQEFYALLNYIIHQKDDFSKLDSNEGMPEWFRALKYKNGQTIYPNGKALFEGVINDLSWLQHMSRMSRITTYDQHKRMALWKVIADDKLVLRPIQNSLPTGIISHSNFAEVLKLIACWPGVWAELAVTNPKDPGGHAISIALTLNGKYKYFDSNFPCAVPETDSIDQVIKYFDASKHLLRWTEIQIQEFDLYKFYSAEKDFVNQDIKERKEAMHQLWEGISADPSYPKISYFLNFLIQSLVKSISNPIDEIIKGVKHYCTKLLKKMGRMNHFCVGIFYSVLSDHQINKEAKLELINVLIESGFDVNAIDDEGFGAVHYAILKNNSHEKMLEELNILKQANGNLNLETKYGDSPTSLILDKEALAIDDKIVILKELPPLRHLHDILKSQNLTPIEKKKLITTLTTSSDIGSASHLIDLDPLLLPVERVLLFKALQKCVKPAWQIEAIKGFATQIKKSYF